MQNNFKIPVLVVGYNRRKNLVRTIERLIRFGIEEIYVAIDGPKDNTKSISAADLNESFSQMKFPSTIRLNCWIRDENLGLAVSMVTAIDWFFSQVVVGAIFEDDLNFDRDFIDYLNVNHVRILSGEYQMVSGNNFFKTEGAEYLTSTYPLIWGWCTSRDYWAVLRELVENPKIRFRNHFSLKVKAFWYTGVVRSKYGIVDSWAIPLASGFHQEKFRCLLPPENLVFNMGNDLVATHTAEFPSGLNMQLGKFSKEIDYEFSLDFKYVDRLIENLLYNIRIQNILSPLKILNLYGAIRKSKTLKQKLQEITIPRQ